MPSGDHIASFCGAEEGMCPGNPQVILVIISLSTCWPDRKMGTSVKNSKITADGDCSHEIKRCLLFGRKATANLDSILKRRDITLPKKVHLVKAVVFPVVVYGCESWTIKKAEH